MILVIDNYDSFTYNLVQILGGCGVEVRVCRNDEVTMPEIDRMELEGIMLSPGPCTPAESGVCLDISRAYFASVSGRPPLFGVCLGHQAIGQEGGGTVARAGRIMHGKTSLVRHDGQGLFAGMPSPFLAVRYHSLVVDRKAVPPGFVVSATAEDDGEIMGLRHSSLPIESVQFHPESVLTEFGARIIENFVTWTRASR